jgi:hypothetical protein
MKPLDFIKTPSGNIGMITEVSTIQGVHSASVEFLNTFNEDRFNLEKNSWWSENEFEIIDNLPDLLSRKLSHPFGNKSLQPFRYVKKEDK